MVVYNLHSDSTYSNLGMVICALPIMLLYSTLNIIKIIFTFSSYGMYALYCIVSHEVYTVCTVMFKKNSAAIFFLLFLLTTHYFLSYFFLSVFLPLYSLSFKFISLFLWFVSFFKWFTVYLYILSHLSFCLPELDVSIVEEKGQVVTRHVLRLPRDQDQTWNLLPQSGSFHAMPCHLTV